MSFIEPHALEVIRLASDMSQSALSRATHGRLSQAWISNAEAGKTATNEEHARVLADALGCPPDFLAANVEFLAPASSCAFFRKRSDLGVGRANQLIAVLSLTHFFATACGGRPQTSLARETPDDDGLTTPAEIAQATRMRLGIPPGPISNLTAVLESTGVLVVETSLGSDRVDALSHWPNEGRPTILVSDAIPGDRLRHTLAHETGHLVMHQMPRERQEPEADEFAAEFLMPAADIRNSLDNLTLAKLADLKSEWSSSMAAILRRSRDLGRVTERQYRSLNIELSRSGYRKREPVAIDRESATSFQSLAKGCDGWIYNAAEWISQINEPEEHSLNE